MAEPKETALVLCVRKDPKYGDRTLIREGLIPVDRVCQYCGVDLIASPSTVALESARSVLYACNPCGNKTAAERGVKKLGIAPGALKGVTPDERRRRNELEAHGFQDLEED